MSKPTKKTNDLWAQHFRAALAPKKKVPDGDGWLTRAEFQKKANVCDGVAKRYLQAELKAGRMERFHGLLNGNNCVWYRPIA